MAEACLLFQYRLDERIPLSRPAPYRHVERWVVSVLADSSSSGEGPPVEIGYAHVIVFNLEPGQDVSDLADPASGTWLDSDDGPELDRAVSTHVLLLDRVWLREDHRGQGLGPIIAAAVIDRLGRGCHLAACYPAPFEASGTDEERDRAVVALGRVWAKVGFRHWRDGVWMLHPQEDDTHAVLSGLLAARATRPMARRAR